MSRDEYLERICNAYDNGKISEEKLELLIANMDLVTE